MPSMKCAECKKIKRCTGKPEVGENGRVVLVYYCSPCRRDIEELERKAEE